MTAEKNGRPVWGRRTFERELVSLHLHLYKFARSLTKNHDEAQDLVQDTFVRALIAWESYDPGSNMLGWAFTILRNRFLSIKRRSWRDVTLSPDMADLIPDDNLGVCPEQADYRRELQEVALRILVLPEEQGNAILATRYLGMSYLETAGELGCLEGTIKSRVSRGMQAISDPHPPQVPANIKRRPASHTIQKPLQHGSRIKNARLEFAKIVPT